MSKTPQEWLDKINEERKKGNVCFMTLEGLASQSLENIVQQPAEGILYDLNRLPEVVATWIDGDKKWVNDYAVGDIITYLKKQNDALRTEIDEINHGFELQRQALVEKANECNALQSNLIEYGHRLVSLEHQLDMRIAEQDAIRAKLDEAKEKLREIRKWDFVDVKLIDEILQKLEEKGE